MSKRLKHFYEFGPFSFDEETRVLLRRGCTVPLEPKTAETLLAIVRASGEVLGKNDLLKQIWPDSFVTEDSLTRNISLLRKLLGPELNGEGCIETFPKRGYCFRFPVTERWAEVAGPATPEQPARDDTDLSGKGAIASRIIPTGSETTSQASPSRETTSTSVPLAPVQAWTRRWRFGSIFLSLVCAVAIVSFFVARTILVTTERDSSAPVTAHVRPRRSVVVLRIRNGSARPRDAWLSTALSEMLTTELAAGGKFRVLSQEKVARLKADLAISDTAVLKNEEISHAQATLGADLIVTGTYIVLDQKEPNPLRLDLSVEDAKSGDVVALAAERGRSTDLFEIVSHIGARLRDKLQVQEVSREEEEGIKASMPFSSDATRFYAQGLIALRSFDLLVARDLFERAVAVEPEFPLAHLRLAEDWSILGYDERAKEEAKKAFDLAGKLSQEARLWVEGTYREMDKEWDLAIEIYRRLWSFFPDDPDYGLELASAQTSAERYHDALSVLDELRRRAVPEGDRARIDLAEAMSSDNVDQGRELEAAKKARTDGESQNARLLVARATLLESYAYGDSGHGKEALDKAIDAQNLFAATGDKVGYARAIIYEANVLRSGGNLAKRKQLYEEALRVCQSIGNKRCEAGALNNLAGVLEDLGELSGAEKRYEESLAVRRAVNDKGGTATALNNIGTVLLSQLNLRGARRAYKQALDIYRSVGAKPEEGMALDNIAEVFELQGDLGQANETINESLAVWQQLGSKSIFAAAPRADMGHLLLLAGNLEGAERLYEQSISITTSVGDANATAAMRTRLASVWIEKNRLGDAERTIRQCREIFRREKQKSEESLAETLLLRILLRQGRLEEARSEVGVAARLVSGSHGTADDIRLGIVLADVRAALGDVAQATKSLHNILNTTAKYGLVEYALLARLTLGEIEMRSGNANGRVTLKDLHLESRRRGFGTIAQEAERASQGNVDIRAFASHR